MCNTELGIFMSCDPLGYIDSMNMYAYCGNNPTNFVDPWGLRHYTRREVEKILSRGRDKTYNPMKHAFPPQIPNNVSHPAMNQLNDYAQMFGFYPGYDFGAGGKSCDTYDVPKYGTMSATEFTNYFAGYLGGYHGSALGWLGMRAFGNMYENGNLNFISGDCQNSVRDINNGAYDGIRRRRSDVKETFSRLWHLLGELF